MESCNKVLVSVIVAIYKVGEYIEQCVQSILDQTYRDLEIILVDDGSPDNCPEICDVFSKNDPRIIVIHKINEGSVYARRTGLHNATGKYVLMVDGDDYMDSYYIENLVNEAEKTAADVVVDSYKISYISSDFVERIYHEVGIYQNDKLKNLKERLIYSGTYFEFGINPALWNKLFNRDKLIYYYQNIPQQLTLGEDFAVSVPFMSKANCISILDSNAYYHYRQREDSMVRAYDEKLNQKVGCLIDYLDQQESLRLFNEQLRYYYSWLYMSCIKNVAAKDCNLNDMAKALEKTSGLLEKIGNLDGLKGLGYKYCIIREFVNHKRWKVLAFLFLVKKQVKKDI